MKKIFRIFSLLLLVSALAGMASCSDKKDDGGIDIDESDAFRYTDASALYTIEQGTTLVRFDLMLSNDEDVTVGPPCTLALYSTVSSASSPTLANGTYKPGLPGKTGVLLTGGDSFIRIVGEKKNITDGTIEIKRASGSTYSVSGTIICGNEVGLIRYTGEISYSQVGGLRPVE